MEFTVHIKVDKAAIDRAYDDMFDTWPDGTAVSRLDLILRYVMRECDINCESILVESK